MPEQTNFGLAHFLGQADAVGLALFVVLIAMSVLSWAVIIGRVRQQAKRRAAESAFLAEAEQQYAARPEASTLGQLAEQADHRYAQLLRAGLAARGLSASDDALGRSLEQAIEDQVIASESGQTILASVASTAPFVGLLGTVWGIYHALLAIGLSGESSLDQVAGPVGEALIMTALGLGVAIPAAVAYNLFARRGRVETGDLERFAHWVYLRLSRPS